MRWYKLQIGYGYSAIRYMQFQMEAQKSMPPRMDNPTPLNIQFNVTVNASLDAQVGSVLKIYNVDLKSYAQLRQYVGAPIRLDAGFDEGSPMVKALGYPVVMDKTVILGRVQSVVGNFQTHDPWIAISCGPYSVDPGQESNISEIYKGLGESPTQTSLVPLQIKPQSKTLKDVLIQAFSYFLDETWSFLTSTKLATMTLTGNSQALFTGIMTLAQLISIARTKWGIGSAFDYTCNRCLLYKRGNLNGDYGDYAELAGLGSTFSTPTTISRAEFLEQPEALGINRISVTIALRADLHLGNFVTLEGMVPQMSSFTGMDSFISKGVSDNITLFSPGIYMIIAINHNGDFYGTDASSWSTKLELIYVDGKMKEEAAKNAAAKVEKSKGIPDNKKVSK